MSKSTVHSRLEKARKSAGYATAREASEAIGVSYPTYAAHENGQRGLARSAERYAKFFHVSLDWLLTGIDEPLRPKPSTPGRKASPTFLEQIVNDILLEENEGKKHFMLNHANDHLRHIGSDISLALAFVDGEERLIVFRKAHKNEGDANSPYVEATSITLESDAEKAKKGTNSE